VAEKNVLQSTKVIRERSPYPAKYLNEGKVGLFGDMYDVAIGGPSGNGFGPSSAYTGGEPGSRRSQNARNHGLDRY
jgi:hypothetical protein